MTATTLATAVAAAVECAAKAGADTHDAEDECVSFAATLSETSIGAGTQWAQQLELDIREYGTYASKGRRWRQHPTPIVRQLATNNPTAAQAYAAALANIATAAANLGTPSITGIATANMAANAQHIGARQPATPQMPEPVVPLGPGNNQETTTTATTGASDISEETKTARPLDEVLAELDNLVGLAAVKAEVKRQAQVLRVTTLRKQATLPTVDINRHMVFVGNPGTGKTTIARLIADIYHSMGLLNTGQLIEVDRSGLVAGYVGQTAIKTREAIDKAIGGMLFIDEAYALDGDQYGDEATDTLVKGMEDERDQLIVGVAGYPNEMFDWLATNPGLESRFRLVLHFDDYSDDELVKIFQTLAERNKYTVDEPALCALETIISAQERGQGFGNARFVRNMFEGAVVAQAWRLRDVATPSVEELCAINADDINAATANPTTP